MIVDLLKAIFVANTEIDRLILSLHVKIFISILVSISGVFSGQTFPMANDLGGSIIALR